MSLISPLPKIVKRLIDCAEQFHGQQIIGRQTSLLAQYTPFPGKALPRHTRYFSDGRAANIEVLVDQAVHSVRIYGANVHEYRPLSEAGKDFTGIEEKEADNWKLFEQIAGDPRKFLRAYTLGELETKLGFYNEMQRAHLAKTGTVLSGLPFPVHYQPVQLDIEQYRSSFFEQGKTTNNNLRLERIYAQNMTREPYQMAVVFEGVSMRVRDLEEYTTNKGTKNQKRLEPFILNLFGQSVLNRNSLRAMLKRFANSLITTMNFVHQHGRCIWRNEIGNANMGTKDVSITGNIFDPEPVPFSLREASCDKFQILLGMMSFLHYFRYRFPRQTLMDLAKEMVNNTGFSWDAQTLKTLFPPPLEILVHDNPKVWV